LIVPQEEAAVIEDRVLLEQAMSKLRDIEREALVSFYLGAMSQSDIAQKLGISCNYVSHVLRQALNKLRRFLAKEENPSVAEGRTSSVSLPIQPMQDPISGVYSEAYLHARLEEELHRASSACYHLGILLAYFKGLKQLKNYYGEESVEEFLSDAGTFLKGFASKLDVVCRYKASGFVLILPYMGARTRYLRNQLAEETLSWLRSRQAPTHFIQVEFGYALYPYDGNTAKELLEKAFSRLRSNLTKELASGDTSSRAA
jgi:diguanylate cyclase (GGDEF)-like protein